MTHPYSTTRRRPANGITAMVAQMQSAIPPAPERAPRARLSDVDRLTIQHLIAEGHDNKEIARRTAISYRVVSEIRCGLERVGA